MWEGFQRLRNSIRDVFPFILAPISFTQKPPAICVNLLIDTVSETGGIRDGNCLRRNLAIPFLLRSTC